MFKPKGPFCQSCGMPLSKDLNGGGTNADGSISTVYCSRCYMDGKFLEPNITCEEMMVKVEGKIKEMHIPKFLAKRFTKTIRKLERWKKA